MFLLRGKRLFERNKDAPFRTVKECYILVMINEKKRSTYLLFFSSFTCFVNSQQPWSLMKRNILVYLQINERGQIPRRRPNICFVSVWGKCFFSTTHAKTYRIEQGANLVSCKNQCSNPLCIIYTIKYIPTKPEWLENVSKIYLEHKISYYTNIFLCLRKRISKNRLRKPILL